MQPIPTDADAPKDNLFGVCAALGEDFRFNPLYLRLAFAASLLWHAEIVLAVYAGAGLVVGATRLLFPNGKNRPAQPAPVTLVAEREEAHEASVDQPLLEAA